MLDCAYFVSTDLICAAFSHYSDADIAVAVSVSLDKSLQFFLVSMVVFDDGIVANCCLCCYL